MLRANLIVARHSAMRAGCRQGLGQFGHQIGHPSHGVRLLAWEQMHVSIHRQEMIAK
ncbi:MAG: hypothetical protein JNM18_05175 [Planctomycetaceae bacterium]|nr:hypothetical protein [Planctomycetaceae bacterium]